MNKTLKKTLSIILTVLMIVTTVPFAFAADCVHDYSGEHTCLGYYCGNCGDYYGEPGPHWWISDQCMICLETHEHTGDAGTICMGTLCEICYYPYGEVTDPDAHDWNSSGTCGYCGAECEHPYHTDGVCDDCGKKCSHEGQSGACKICGANLGKLVIDLSEVTSSFAEIGNGYTYYDEDGYIITGTNTNVTIDINDSCDITFNNMSAKSVYIWSSAENVTVTLDGDNYMYGYFNVYKSHLTINGDDDDTLNIVSNTSAFSTSGNPGTLTVNGGKINAVIETTSNYPTIWCGGGFTLNDGEFTASNNNYYVISDKTIINGGTLNVISTSPDMEAINGDVEIAKGALLTVSTTYKAIPSYYNITSVNEAEENLFFFAKFDTASDFAIVSDIKDVIKDKTYAEIKVDTHEHDLDNSGKCICGYECPHESYTDGKCGVCGYECPHENFNDGTCNDCGYECPHEGQSGACEVCGVNLGKLVIDLSEVTSSYINIGNGYDYYDEDGYIITGTNTNVTIYINDSCDITFNNMSAYCVDLYSDTEENVTVTLDGDNYMYAAFIVYKSHLTINGNDDDTLTIESSSAAFSTFGHSGSLAVNGGKITAVTETTESYPTIFCYGGFTLNGGEVTASNNYSYVILNKTIINGGTLNVISTSSEFEAIRADIEIAKGALLTVSATYKLITSYNNITPVNEAEENLLFFAKFDTDSDFAPVSDIKAALDGKTYAEIKVDAHEHDLDNNGKCVCGYVCLHENYTGGKCDVCGYVCLHENYTGGKCDICGYECLHENYTDGKCDDCGYVNIDYTEIDEYIKSLEEKLDNDRIWDGRYKAALDYYKSVVEEMKDNVNTSAADLAAIENDLKYLEAELDDLLKEIAETMAIYDRIIGETGKYTEENVKSSDIEAYEQFIKDIGNIIPECLTENEIAALEEAIRKLDNLYRVIDNVQAVIRDCQGWLDSESEETIRPDDKDNLQITRDSIQSLIDGDNITDEERATLNEMLEKVETLENRIAEIENCANGVHSFTKYEEVTAPECGKAGLEIATCDHGCGATDENEIPALEHEPLDAVVENEVAPKCGVAGSYDIVVYCDVCDEELDRDTVAVDALTHTDADGDYLCDHGCGHEFEKPVDPTPDEPADDTCDHLCHKDGILGFLWKIISFFFRLFNIQQYCDCGVIHYDAPIFG